MVGAQYIGNTRSSPRWLADFGGRDSFIPAPAKIDASAFSNLAGVKVVLTANAAVDATSLTVTALTAPTIADGVVIATGNTIIPIGAVLDFGGKKLARVTANAVIGATTISVAALGTALVSGDTTYYARNGQKFIPSGTPVGRTYAERDAGTGFGPWAVADEEKYISAFDVVNAAVDNDIVLVRHFKVIKENYLPQFDAVLTGTAIMTDIRALYQCIKGTD